MKESRILWGGQDLLRLVFHMPVSMNNALEQVVPNVLSKFVLNHFGTSFSVHAPHTVHKLFGVNYSKYVAPWEPTPVKLQSCTFMYRFMYQLAKKLVYIYNKVNSNNVYCSPVSV